MMILILTSSCQMSAQSEYRCSDYPSCYCQANITAVERSCRCYVQGVGVVHDQVCQALQVTRPTLRRACETTTCST